MLNEISENREQRTENRGGQLRVLLFIRYFLFSVFCFLFSVSAGCSHAAPEKPQGPLVYLKVTNAEASSFEETPDWAPRPNPMAPVDGDYQTRWSPRLASDDEWIYFDFGQPKTMSRIIIRWEEAYASKYEILASDDAKTWKRILLKEDGKGGVEELNFGPVTTRYVKIIGKKRVNPEWGFSMWELEMYGPKELNPYDRPIEDVFPTRDPSAKDDDKTPKVKVVEGEIVPSPGVILPGEFHKGVNYTSWNADELGLEVSDSSLVYLANLGVKHVALMVVWYQPDAHAKAIFPDPKKTASDASLAHAINVCHKLGMKVMLKSHVDLEDGEFRTNILPNQEWFDSYKKFILHYAELSAKYNVEIFSVGTELSNTSIKTWRGRWSDIINDVRKIYKGPIIYDANWDEYETVSFWNEVDYIGIDAYFPLTEKKDPTKEDLAAAWKDIADKLEAWLKVNNLAQKGIVFTEVGYDAVDGSNMQPWRVLPTIADQKEDQREQADCLDSMMRVLSGRNWFRGFYWWNYFPRPDLGALGYTLRNKEGEKVLVDWFKKVE
jgi:hypothetical protein